MFRIVISYPGLALVVTGLLAKDTTPATTCPSFVDPIFHNVPLGYLFFRSNQVFHTGNIYDAISNTSK